MFFDVLRPTDVHTTQVGLPYLRSKAQDYFEELGGGIDPELANAGNERHVLALTEQVRQIVRYGRNSSS